MQIFGPVRVRGWLIALLLAAVLAPPGAAQTTWNVPDDVATIQGAIVAASNGDTIAIEPGTYAEALDVLGKNLTIVGLGGAAATIVDATGFGTSALRLGYAPVQNSTFVQGLTLTGGAGTLEPSGLLRGGGVYSAAGNHVLQDCIIRNNKAIVTCCSGSSYGGGVWAGGHVTLQDCELAFNSADAGGGAAEGGVLLVGCHVHDNTAETGGGLWNVGSAKDCLIESNTSTSDGGGASYYQYYVQYVSNCVFRGNHAATVGGGLSFEDYWITGNRFEGNTAGVEGGGVFVSSGVGGQALGVTVDGCVFAGNSAPVGDGLRIITGYLNWPFGHLEVSRCTFVGNQVFHSVYAPPGGVAMLTVRNVIARGHPDPIDAPLDEILYCDIQGGTAGTGNIDADPLFVDEAGDNYALQPGSPCINTGDPSSPLDPDGSVADMGALAYAYAPWTVLGGAIAGSAGAPSLTGAGSLLGGQKVRVSLAGAPPLQSTTLIVGSGILGAPFKGGTLWPTLDVVVPGLPVDASGQWTLAAAWPAGIPSGLSLRMQVWFADSGAPFAFAATNGLIATTP